jgi:hypothetical protein
MNANQINELRSSKAKKAAPLAQAASNASPTTFFLKTEKELEQAVSRGRKLSRSSADVLNDAPTLDLSSSVADTLYGVQSLEETLNSAYSSSSDLSRASSQSHDEHSPAAARDGKLLDYKKRKTGNRVHPTIRSAGHRIISSEQSPHSPSATASPLSARSTESPLRARSFRRSGSSSSSINFNHLLTPVKSNPKPLSLGPSTPRSSSAKSFQLSDEEICMMDETNSQAVVSSHGDDEVDLERTPQLVMPSLAMPTRRPFTEQGRSMGRLKVMVIGPRGVGKTSLISTILSTSDHVVHIDSPPASTSLNSSSTRTFVETSASTKPLPTWWSDINSKKTARRRMSVGDVLDRNLTFIDSPPTDDDDQWRRTAEYIAQSTRRATHIDAMGDAEVIAMLAGEGGVQIDAVVCIFPLIDNSSTTLEITETQQECLRLIAECTNLIPVIGQADRMTDEILNARRRILSDALRSARVETYEIAGGIAKPLAVSSARKDDADIIDASVLMSSQYMPPLVTSGLHCLVEHLFDPSNMARLCRLSAQRAATYRKNHPSDPQPTFAHIYNHQPYTHTGHLNPLLNPDSILLDEETSKVLVPHSTSSYYRSTSPTISDFSTAPPPSSAYALARYNALPTDPTRPQQPIREIVTARWAEDLTRRSPINPLSDHYHPNPSPWPYPSSVPDNAVSEKGTTLALPRHHHQNPNLNHPRPSRGRLGGALRVIDPRDPLGILAFGQRSLFALRIAGGCGLLGALCYCVVRFWQVGWWWGFEGLVPSWNTPGWAAGGGGGAGQQVHVLAVPAPTTRTGIGSWEALFRAAGLGGWGR